MSEQDGLGHALEVTRRTALTGGAAGLAAYFMSGCGVFGGDDDSDQAARAQGSPAPGTFGELKKMRFVFVNHVTTNPFFVPDALRRRGRVQAAWTARYQWTGSESANVNEMVNAFNSAISGEGGRHRGLPRRREGVQRPDAAALEAGIPVVGYNADVAQRPAVVHRPGPVRLRPGDGQADRRPRRRGRRRAVHRDARLAEHPAAHRRRASTPSSRQAPRSSTHVIATGAALPEELSTIDAYYVGPQGRQGHVRRRRRQHPGRRADDPEVQAAREGRQGRRLRPARADAEAARRGPDRLHDRPAAVPAGLPTGARSCSCTRRRRR